MTKEREALEFIAAQNFDGAADFVIARIAEVFVQKAKEALAQPPLPVQEPAPGRNVYEDGDVFERIAAAKKPPQPVQPDHIPDATKMVQPTQEPAFGWIKQSELAQARLYGGSVNLWLEKHDCDFPVYTAPPQRQQLTNGLEIKVKRELFRFHSEQEWVNKAQSWYADCGVRNITVDAAGHVIHMGKCFKNAAYPVTCYELQTNWPHKSDAHIGAKP